MKELESENAFLDEDEGIIELEDEEGNITRFEFVDSAELDGTLYYALIPTDYDESSEDDEAADFVVLKEQVIDGEAMLSTIDDDDEYTRIGEMFLERFSKMAEDIDLSDLTDLEDLKDLEKIDGGGEE